MTKPTSLDWGPATIEFINDDRKLGIHVFNHEIETPEGLRKTQRFATARVAWFRQQLPNEYRQMIALDDRGQEVSDDAKRQLREALAAYGADVAFFSEEVPGGLQSIR